MLEDAAEVTSGAIPNLTAVAAKGKDAVVLSFYQQPGADAVEIGKSVKAAIALTEGPFDITIKPYYDQSELVVASEHRVRDPIGIGIGIGAAFAALILETLGALALILSGLYVLNAYFAGLSSLAAFVIATLATTPSKNAQLTSLFTLLRVGGRYPLPFLGLNGVHRTGHAALRELARAHEGGDALVPPGTNRKLTGLSAPISRFTPHPQWVSFRSAPTIAMSGKT